MLLYFASNNENKFKELKNIASNYPFLKLLISPYNIEVEECGKTYYQNSFKKARFLYEKLKKFVVADDSGLEIFKFEKFPGIFSSRIASSNEERISKIIKLIREIPDEKRKARFVSNIVLCLSDTEIYSFTGICEGIIIEKPKGENGFGYDPIFFLKDYNKTMAELTLDEKNSISHRAKAFRKAFEFLKQLNR